LSPNEKGTSRYRERRVPFGVFACTAAFAAVPLWPLISADNDRHRAAVLGIGFFGRTEFGRTFLAIADDVDPRRIDAERREIVFRGIGAAFAERDIVVAGAAFVGMAFERDADGGVALQPLRLVLQRRLVLRVDIILVVIEKTRSPSRPTLARKSSCEPGTTPVPVPAPVSPVPSGAGGSVSGAFFAQAPTASMVIAAIIAVLFRIVMFSVLLLLKIHSCGRLARSGRDI
jgi:hypothetical protein